MSLFFGRKASRFHRWDGRCGRRESRGGEGWGRRGERKREKDGERESIEYPRRLIEQTNRHCCFDYNPALLSTSFISLFFFFFSFLFLSSFPYLRSQIYGKRRWKLEGYRGWPASFWPLSRSRGPGMVAASRNFTPRWRTWRSYWRRRRCSSTLWTGTSRRRRNVSPLWESECSFLHYDHDFTIARVTGYALATSQRFSTFSARPSNWRTLQSSREEKFSSAERTLDGETLERLFSFCLHLSEREGSPFNFQRKEERKEKGRFVGQTRIAIA